MKIRPWLTLDAEQIRTPEEAAEARRVSIPPPVIPPEGWQVRVGDWLITKPNGEKFVWPQETFEATYEKVS